MILVSVFVCTLAIQGAATRMMFSMGRDRHLPLGGVWGHVNPSFKTPANAAIAVGILAAIPILVTDQPAASVSTAARPGLIYLSYFLCNLGVSWRAGKGWPHKPAWFNLGGWGMTVNILALVWGGLMIINFALWSDAALFGDLRRRPARLHEPDPDASCTSGRPADRGLPDLAVLRGASSAAHPHRRGDLLRGRPSAGEQATRSRPTPRPARPSSARPSKRTGNAAQRRGEPSPRRFTVRSDVAR